mmetsp:Transcript_102701/g.260887  ORF Transcript_102701/g.260887 Transcript_102701/m.260887 type:complete len:591 (-) Transcript_102701:83-1855(-)
MAPPPTWRRPARAAGRGLARSVVVGAGGAVLSVVVLLHRRSFPSCRPLAGAGAATTPICALLPPTPSSALARAPSTSLDRLPSLERGVTILPEPVERPLSRYLHKYDNHFGRIVPDWERQYRTLEQQYLYGGDFSMYVRELTTEGCVVQDSVTGLLGFVPNYKFDVIKPTVGLLVHGAQCLSYDDTVIQSTSISLLRLQTGIVYEWDAERGEGYVMPTEEQEAVFMYRVLRRDVDWHGSRRLSVGQFVQFETALPGEVPIEANDDPRAPFALRVRSPEVVFTFEHAYFDLPPGAGKLGRVLQYDPDGDEVTGLTREDLAPPKGAAPRALPEVHMRPAPKALTRDEEALMRVSTELKERESPDDAALAYFPKETSLLEKMDGGDGYGPEFRLSELGYATPDMFLDSDIDEDEDKRSAEGPVKGDWEAQAQEIEEIMRRQRHVMPVMSGRAVKVKERSHPVLQRWLDRPTKESLAESPAWMWEPVMRQQQEEDWDDIGPMMPVMLERRTRGPIRIMQHEVAIARGDTYQEEAYRKTLKSLEKIRGPSLKDMEVLGMREVERQKRVLRRETRQLKLRAASTKGSQKLKAAGKA